MIGTKPSPHFNLFLTTNRNTRRFRTLRLALVGLLILLGKVLEVLVGTDILDRLRAVFIRLDPRQVRDILIHPPQLNEILDPGVDLGE